MVPGINVFGIPSFCARQSICFSQEWWDVSSEAGPKVRARESYSIDRPSMQILTIARSKLAPLSFNNLRSPCYLFADSKAKSIHVSYCFFRIPAAVEEQMESQQAESQALCKEIRSEIHAWNSKWEMVLRGGSGESIGQPSSEPLAPQNRLLCQPNFDPDEQPIDVTKQYSFPEDAIVPLESVTEPLGSEQSPLMFTIVIVTLS